jgi:hypothetical protein
MVMIKAEFYDSDTVNARRRRKILRTWYTKFRRLILNVCRRRKILSIFALRMTWKRCDNQGQYQGQFFNQIKNVGSRVGL